MEEVADPATDLEGRVSRPRAREAVSPRRGQSAERLLGGAPEPWSPLIFPSCNRGQPLSRSLFLTVCLAPHGQRPCDTLHHGAGISQANGVWEMGKKKESET